MGRVIDDGGVFAPRLELKRIQQGRIPFRERLAEKYLSPTGVAQTMKNVGQIASLLGEIEFDPMKQKTGQDAAKSVAQKRIGGELPEGMTRVGMATGQGAPSVTGRDAGRELIMRGRDSTLAGVSGLPAGIPEANLGVMTDFAQGLEAAPPLSELSPGLETDPESYRISQMAADASRQMRSIGGIPTKMAPGGDQQTYMLQVDAVNRGLLTPQEFAASPGVTRKGTRQHAVVERLRSEFGGTPVAKMERVMPTQEEYEASQRQPEPAQAPSAPVPEAMTPEPYVPTDRPAEPAAAPAAAAPVAAPVAPAAAPAAPAMTQGQRVRKVLDDISAPTYEGQQNALRAMAMQADTAEAQSAILNALSQVRIPARGMSDFLKPKSRRDAFRKEIVGLFPSVKKPPAPMTEKERLGLKIQQRRLDLAEQQLKATEEEREAARKEREAKRKDNKEKRDEAKRARRAKGRVSGAKTMGQLRAQIEREITTAGNRIKVQSPRMRTVRERIGVLKKREGELLRLQAKQEKPEKPIKRPSKKARRKEIALYEAAVRRRDTREAARKKALKKTEGELEKVRTSIAGLNPEFVAMGASRNRRENYQRALRALQTSGMPVSDMRTALQNLIGLQADPGRDDSEVTSMFAEFARNPKSLLQMNTTSPESRDIETLKRQLSSIEKDIQGSKFTVTVKPDGQSSGVLVEGDISQELEDKIRETVRKGRYVGKRNITLPVGGN